jgi:hypothetical protein
MTTEPTALAAGIGRPKFRSRGPRLAPTAHLGNAAIEVMH